MARKFKYSYLVDTIDIVKQWDSVADLRHNQLRYNIDLSFEYVLIPNIFKLSCDCDCDFDFVLDAGCGTGVFSEKIAKKANSVVGVDISSSSIDIANINKVNKNLFFVNSSIEAFSSKERYSLVVANMFFQDTPKIEASISAISRLIKNNGCLVLTMTHPFFWPKYWGYEKELWFSYDKEIAIETDFIISNNEQGVGVTTHFHRPLSMYISLLIQYGFKLLEFSEPIPPLTIQKLYKKPWEYPRFLALKLMKMV